MTSHEYILYRNATLQLAMAGIGALVICFVSLAVFAEPALKQYALIEQENFYAVQR